MIGKILQRIRQQKGLSAESVARASHISTSTINKIECGAIKDPRLFTVHPICVCLDVSIDQVISLAIKELSESKIEVSQPVTEKETET